MFLNLNFFLELFLDFKTKKIYEAEIIITLHIMENATYFNP